jgi:putative inorganic carbon (hco3(-)) transporter
MTSSLLPLVAAAALTLGALGYLAWHVQPAWLLTGGLCLSTFNSNWDVWGLPPRVAPDRLVLLAGIAAVLLRSPAVRDRPPLRLHPVHLLFFAVVAWCVASALGAGKLTSGPGPYLIIDRLAVPFAVFIVAPYAFRTPAQRQILLGTMVGFGAYVGLTTLFESIGPRAFVIPPRILDASIGYHIGRGRGPFLEGSVNGVGLYVSIIFCALALATWRGRWPRMLAIGVAAVCAVGLVLTLTRSVWVGAIVTTCVTMACVRELRRFLVPVAAAAVVGVVALFAAVPALQAQADERRSTQRSVWEREQVNGAALDLAMEQPLVGQGIGTFNERNALHFRLPDRAPMVAELHLGIHNQFLQLLTETGLIGVSLFVACLLVAIGGTLMLRGPPEARPWKIALLAASLFWALVANLAPIGQVFPSTVLWLLAGAVTAACAAPPHVAGRGLRA